MAKNSKKPYKKIYIHKGDPVLFFVSNTGHGGSAVIKVQC